MIVALVHTSGPQQGDTQKTQQSEGTENQLYWPFGHCVAVENKTYFEGTTMSSKCQAQADFSTDKTQFETRK